MDGEWLYLKKKREAGGRVEEDIRLPMEKKEWQIQQENLPNLSNIYEKYLGDSGDVIEGVIKILKEKLRNNLVKMPAVYQSVDL